MALCFRSAICGTDLGVCCCEATMSILLSLSRQGMIDIQVPTPLPFPLPFPLPPLPFDLSPYPFDNSLSPTNLPF